MCSPAATGSPGERQVQLDQVFEKMLPAFIKIFKPSVPKLSGDPLEYSKFKEAFIADMGKKDVYDATEKLKFLLDAVEGNSKSCFAKFMPLYTGQLCRKYKATKNLGKLSRDCNIQGDRYIQGPNYTGLTV